jgi:hypothetical protein
MPDLRSSRFVRPFTRNGSMFSRLREPPRMRPNHRHGRSEPDAPLLASSGLVGQKPPRDEPQWAFADGHRCYPAVPALPGLALHSEAPWAMANAHPSLRPDLGTAGPDDEPGDEDDDEESTSNNHVVRQNRADDNVSDDHFSSKGRKEDSEDDFDEFPDTHFVHREQEEDDEDDEDYEVDTDDDEAGTDEDFVVDEWWSNDRQPSDSSNDPLSPTDDLTPWPIETPDDAIDTFELLRSATFVSGLVVLVLDHNRIPFLHVALRGNPVDDIQRALSLFCPSLPNGRIPSGLILGVVRPQHRAAPQSVLDSGEAFCEPSIWVDPVESAAWRVAAWNLHDEGIRLHDVIVIEPDRWLSLAHAAGLIAYDTLQYA